MITKSVQADRTIAFGLSGQKHGLNADYPNVMRHRMY
jgi:hypothetical protein